MKIEEGKADDFYLWLLKKVFSLSEKEKKEKELLHALNEICIDMNEYYQKEEILLLALSSRKSFTKKTVLNCVKAVGASTLAALFAEYGLDCDSSLLFDATAVTASGAIGFSLFQKDLVNSKKHVTPDQFLSIYDEFNVIFEKMLRNIAKYVEVMDDYCEKFCNDTNELTWNEELEIIFLNNEDYIKENAEFADNFSYPVITTMIHDFNNRNENRKRKL